MFYLLMALTQGERCGTEITAFAAEITPGGSRLARQRCIPCWASLKKEGLIAETSVLGL